MNSPLFLWVEHRINLQNPPHWGFEKQELHQENKVVAVAKRHYHINQQ